MDNEIIQHHGVKGMRWGVRRNKGSAVGKVLRRTVSTAVSDVKTAANMAKSKIPKKKRVKDMTDQELRAHVERLRLEQSYKDLQKQARPESYNRAKKFALDVAESAAKNLATQTLVFAGGKVINTCIKNATGIENAINPKKGQKDK